MERDQSALTRHPLGNGHLTSKKRRLNIVEICRSLDEIGLTKRQAYPSWILVSDSEKTLSPGSCEDSPWATAVLRFKIQAPKAARILSTSPLSLSPDPFKLKTLAARYRSRAAGAMTWQSSQTAEVNL